jgi:RimJ/RimL family protein N-acetyltransferase
MTTLKTERLILRPLALADAPRFSALSSDPGVARMTRGIPCPNPPIAAEGWILLRLARAPLGVEQNFAIERPGEGLIGAVGAFLRSCGDQGGWEIGYWIGRPYWGRGYATEAMSALLTFMRERRMAPIHACHFADNPASGRMLEKLGFSATGDIRPGFSLARGGNAPTRFMALPTPDRAAA